MLKPRLFKKMMWLLPNFLTFFRLIAGFIIIYMSKPWNFILFFLASISDFFDGFLARLFKVDSSFGAIFDPIADKIFYGTLCIFLNMSGRIPTIPLILVLIRDAAIIILGLFLKKRIPKFSIRPTMISKINTTCIFLGIGGVLLTVSCAILDIIWISVSILTMLSSIQYAKIFIHVLDQD
jgi:CDP-diacylglycerol--glycerol-3-phosphate 3-phosphatidyltransferase